MKNEKQTRKEIIDNRLMQAGWISRLLFLVDRIALRDQAVEAFKDNAPQYSVWLRTNETQLATDRRIYVFTYPTMLTKVKLKRKI